MRYQGTVIRPPSEADSYLLQITYGCSHNRCTFCGTYPDKPFAVRPMEEVLEDIAMAAARLGVVRRVFLCDGNALVLDSPRLVQILDALNTAFPRLRRISIYANARDILTKTDSELITLREIPPLDKAQSPADARHQALFSLDEVEKRHIQLVLESQRGNKTKAARILGINRPKLYRKMVKYRIPDTASTMRQNSSPATPS